MKILYLTAILLIVSVKTNGYLTFVAGKYWSRTAKTVFTCVGRWVVFSLSSALLRASITFEIGCKSENASAICATCEKPIYAKASKGEGRLR
jgi:hypothetical protein